MSALANTSKPPYYAAIFLSVLTEIDAGYYAMNNLLDKELAKIPGYLGYESAHNEVGITVSYCSDLEALKNWRNLPLLKESQQLGR